MPAFAFCFGSHVSCYKSLPSETLRHRCGSDLSKANCLFSFHGNEGRSSRGRNALLSSAQERRKPRVACSADRGGSQTVKQGPNGPEASLHEVESTILFLSLTYSHPREKSISPLADFIDTQCRQWRRLFLYMRLRSPSAITTYSLVSRCYTKVLIPSLKKKNNRNSSSRNLPFAGPGYVRWLGQMCDRYTASLLGLLVLGYFLQGFRCFPFLAMSYHMQDGMHVDPSMFQFFQSTINLPMVVKPLYGIVSDTLYIGGTRRMPYLVFAGVLQVISWWTISLHSGVRSSAMALMGMLLVGNVGAAVTEVVNDALVAESVQKERGSTKGELQSFVWLSLAAGGIVGNLTGALVLATASSATMFAVFSCLMAGQLVVNILVKEESFKFKKPIQSKMSSLYRKLSMVDIVKQQAMKLVELVTKPEIARSLLWFSASYAIVPSLTGCVFFYQTRYLQIHPVFLGLAKVMGQVGLLAGSLFYNSYLKLMPPRQIIMALQILLSVCMLSDMLLVSRLNIRMGIPDHLYVLGASAFIEAIAQFKLLPFSVLLTELCPAGSEGSLLAFFMSCHCLAIICSGYFGTILASFLHLSVENFTGMPFGILIQSSCALLPLLWISCIPSYPNKQMEIQSVAT